MRQTFHFVVIAATITSICISISFASCPFHSLVSESHDEIANIISSQRRKLLAQSKVVEVEEVQSYDGWGNNPSHPSMGSVGTVFCRLAPSSYQDGISSPSGSTRPNPREVSSTLMSSHEPLNSTDGLRLFQSDRSGAVVTDLHWVFGQMLAHELADSAAKSKPIEPWPISTPLDDTTMQAKIPFQRSRWDGNTGLGPGMPREQVNFASAFIDGGAIYGAVKQVTDRLRSYEGGKMSVDAFDLPPMWKGGPGRYNLANPSRQRHNELRTVGNRRGNESPGLIVLQTLWLREHNRQAEALRAVDPSLSDEELFQRSRRRVIAQFQSIVVNEYLPVIGIVLPEYAGYNAHTDPCISTEFATAAFRFGHSQVTSVTLQMGIPASPTGVRCAANISAGSGDDDGDQNASIRLCRNFFAPNIVMKKNAEWTIDPVVRGLISNRAQEVDRFLVEDVVTFLFAPPFPLKKPRMDLAAVNIQRGRDHGIPDCNTVRRSIGLQPYTSLDDLNNDAEVAAAMEGVYGSSMENIDLFACGLAEAKTAADSNATTGSEALLGETFFQIIRDQFQRVRDGDRFWFEGNTHGYFSDDDLTEIRAFRMRDLIRLNSGVADAELGSNVFVLDGSQSMCTAAEAANTVLGAAACTASLCSLESRQNNAACVDDLRTEEKDVLYGIYAVTALVGVVTSVYLSFHGFCLRSSSFASTSKWPRLSAFVERHFPTILRMLLACTPTSVRRAFHRKDRKRLARNLVTAIRNESRDLLSSLPIDTSDLFELAMIFARESIVEDTDTETISYTGFSRLMGVPEADNYLHSVFRIFTRGNVHSRLTFPQFLRFVSSYFVQEDGLSTKICFMAIDHDDNGYITQAEMAAEIRYLLTVSGVRSDELLHTAEKYSKQLFQWATKQSPVYTTSPPQENPAGASATLPMGVHETSGEVEHSPEEPHIRFEQFSEMIRANASASAPKCMLQPASRTQLGKFLSNHSLSVENIDPQLSEEIQSISRAGRPGRKLIEFVKEYASLLVWVALYFAGMGVIIVERNNFYSNKTAIQLLVDNGIIITRCSAQIISYNIALLLLMRLKTVTRAMRSLQIARKVFPFDYLNQFHRWIGYLTFIAIAVHIFGHVANFQNFAETMSNMLNFQLNIDIDPAVSGPTYFDFIFRTVTGASGFIATILAIVVLVFSTPMLIRDNFPYFKGVHLIAGWGLIIVMFVHGSIALVQNPHYWMFVGIPLVLLMLEKAYVVRYCTRIFTVIRYSWRRSSVLCLELTPSPNDCMNKGGFGGQPREFSFHPGDYVRMKVPSISYFSHPFSLASAPGDPVMKLYVKTGGPFTKALAEHVRIGSEMELTGPFRESFDILSGLSSKLSSIKSFTIVAAGVGITPVSSVLLECLRRAEILAQTGYRVGGFSVERIDCLIVVTDQHHFDSVVDLIASIMDHPQRNLINLRVNLTHAPRGTDIRNVLLLALYSCLNKGTSAIDKSSAGTAGFSGARKVLHKEETGSRRDVISSRRRTHTIGGDVASHRAQEEGDSDLFVSNRNALQQRTGSGRRGAYSRERALSARLLHTSSFLRSVEDVTNDRVLDWLMRTGRITYGPMREKEQLAFLLQIAGDRGQGSRREPLLVCAAQAFAASITSNARKVNQSMSDRSMAMNSFGFDPHSSVF